MNRLKLSTLALAIMATGVAQADYLTIANQTLNQALEDAKTHKSNYETLLADVQPYKKLATELNTFLSRNSMFIPPNVSREKLLADPVMQMNFLRQVAANPQLKSMISMFANIMGLTELASVDQAKAEKAFTAIRRAADQEGRLNTLYTVVILPLLDLQQIAVKDRIVIANQYAEMQYDERMLKFLKEQPTGVFADMSSDNLKNGQFSTHYTMLSVGYKSPLIWNHFSYGAYVNKSLYGKTESSGFGFSGINQRDKADGIGFYGSYQHSGVQLDVLYKLSNHDSDYDNIATILDGNNIKSTLTQGSASSESNDLVVHLGYQFKNVTKGLSLTPYLSYQMSKFDETVGYADTGTEFTFRESKVRAVGLGLSAKYDMQKFHFNANLFAARITNYDTPSYNTSRLKIVSIESDADDSGIQRDLKTYKIPELRTSGNTAEYHLGARLGVRYDLNNKHQLNAAVAYHYYTDSKYKGLSYQLGYTYRF